MKAKILHANGTRTIGLVFETGEEPMQGLLDFARRERMSSAHFHGDRGVRGRDSRLLRLAPEGLRAGVPARAGRGAVAGHLRRRFDPRAKLALIDVAETQDASM